MYLTLNYIFKYQWIASRWIGWRFVSSVSLPHLLFTSMMSRLIWFGKWDLLEMRGRMDLPWGVNSPLPLWWTGIPAEGPISRQNGIYVTPFLHSSPHSQKMVWKNRPENRFTISYVQIAQILHHVKCCLATSCGDISQFNNRRACAVHCDEKCYMFLRGKLLSQIHVKKILK